MTWSLEMLHHIVVGIKKFLESSHMPHKHIVRDAEIAILCGLAVLGHSGEIHGKDFALSDKGPYFKTGILFQRVYQRVDSACVTDFTE